MTHSPLVGAGESRLPWSPHSHGKAAAGMAYGTNKSSRKDLPAVGSPSMGYDVLMWL
jgi:hypothetical protein